MSRDYISDLLGARMERRTDSFHFRVVDPQAVQPSIAGLAPMIVLKHRGILYMRWVDAQIGLMMLAVRIHLTFIERWVSVRCDGLLVSDFLLLPQRAR